MDNYYDDQDYQAQDGGQPDADNKDNFKQFTEPVEYLAKFDNYIDNLFDDIINNIDSDIDTLTNKFVNINLKDITNVLPTDDNNTEDLKKIIKEKFTGLDKSILDHLEDVSIPSERLERYEQYDKLLSSLPLATRMQQVYIDNILIKNPYNKQFINIIESDYFNDQVNLSEDDKSVIMDLTKMILGYFDIQKQLKNKILSTQLKYGNYFIEIVNINELNNIYSKNDSISIMNEQLFQEQEVNNIILEFNNGSLEFDFSLYETEQHEAAVSTKPDFKVQMEQLISKKYDQVDTQSQLLLESVNEHNLGVEQFIDILRKCDYSFIENIQLKYIDPNQVIPIDIGNVLAGYLVIQSAKKKTAKTPYTKQNGAEIWDLRKSVTDALLSNNKKESKTDINDIADTLIKEIFKKVAESKNITKISDLFDNINNPDTVQTLKIILYDKLSKGADIKVRYVPVRRMLNFSNPVDKYSPLGTSIFDSILVPARLYNIGMISSIISRLNRASVVRKWTLETGGARNTSELVEKFKRELRNQSINMNDVYNLKDIANVLSDYKDFVTVSVNGKRYVDMEIVPQHDRNLPMSELDTLKQELVEATGIPSTMLGLTDTIDLREQLVDMNIKFANKISGFQDNISEELEKFLDHIINLVLDANGYKDINFKLTKLINIKLNPPTVLLLQSLESSLSIVSNIANQLQGMQLPVDPESLLKQFIKTVDWAKIKEDGLNAAKEQRIQQVIQVQEQGAQGGGF